MAIVPIARFKKEFINPPEIASQDFLKILGFSNAEMIQVQLEFNPQSSEVFIMAPVHRQINWISGLGNPQFSGDRQASLILKDVL